MAKKLRIGDRVVLNVGSPESGFGTVGTITDVNKDGRYYVKWDTPLPLWYSFETGKSIWSLNSKEAHIACALRAITEGEAT